MVVATVAIVVVDKTHRRRCGREEVPGRPRGRRERRWTANDGVIGESVGGETSRDTLYGNVMHGAAGTPTRVPDWETASENYIVRKTETFHRRIADRVAQGQGVTGGIRKASDVVYADIVEHIGCPTVGNLEQGARAVVTTGADVIHYHIMNAESRPSERHSTVCAISRYAGSNLEPGARMADKVVSDGHIGYLTAWADVRAA